MARMRFRGLGRVTALDRIFSKGFPLEIRAFAKKKKSFVASPIFLEGEEVQARCFIEECAPQFIRFNLERANYAKSKELRQKKTRKKQKADREIAAAIGVAVVFALAEQSEQEQDCSAGLSDGCWKRGWRFGWRSIP